MRHLTTVAVLTALWAIACGDGATVPVTPPATPEPVNRAPEAVGTIGSIIVNEEWSTAVSVFFRDPDGDALIYAAASSDAGVATASISRPRWVTVARVAAGEATITVTATDPGGLSATQSFEVTVPNRAPGAVGTIPGLTLTVGDTESVDVSSYFNDPDGDALSYAATSSDTEVATASLSGSTVTVTGVAKGAATVTVTASDAGGLAAQQGFEVTVSNGAPEAVGTIPDLTLSAGDTEGVDVSSYFIDPDGDVSYAAGTSDAEVSHSLGIRQHGDVNRGGGGRSDDHSDGHRPRRLIGHADFRGDGAQPSAGRASLPYPRALCRNRT